MDYLANIDATDNSTGYVLLDDLSELYISGQSIIADTNEINGTVPGVAPILQILTTLEVMVVSENFLFLRLLYINGKQV